MPSAHTRLQQAIADYLTLACPYPWTAVEHGLKLPPQQARHLKSIGVQRGIMEVMIFVPNGTILLECKTGKGRASSSQKAFAMRVRMLEGHSYHLCRSVDDVEAALLERGVKPLARVA